MLPPVLAVKEPGDKAGWLLTELRRRGVAIIDRRAQEPRYLRFDEGMLIAPFCTEKALIGHLNAIHRGWRRWIVIIRPGAAKVEALLKRHVDTDTPPGYG